MAAGGVPRPVGILGGMGPEATIHLMARILAMTPAEDDRDHVPLLVDNNTQVPSRIAALIEGTGEDPGPVLADMARRLEAWGAAALAMPCNTAHHYAPWIVSAVSVPFLDMVALSVEALARDAQDCPRIGMLASPAVRLTGVFDRALRKAGLEAVYPADQDRMLAAIRTVKAGVDEAGARQTVAEAGRELAQAGAGIVLIACSELSTLADAVPRSVAVRDTVDILAEAVVRFSRADLVMQDGAEAAVPLSA